MKEKFDIQRVINPAWQRLATDQKRTLRSGSVRAARSVWSESRSRVIEFRKFIVCWGLPAHEKGDSIGSFAMAMNGSARPGSKSGAEMDRDVLGTCEGLRLLAKNIRREVNRTTNTWEGERVSSQPFYRKQRDMQGIASQARGKGCEMGIQSGRLSPLIVAFESWVTPLGRSQ
ncbi:MAG: hypothetical protein EOM12_15125 [Verrucomicrobiae bacterium]|nr:hypothetical protein [Verrucomicrobiae bacterium]